MAVTRFEQVSSLMISIVIGLVAATIVTFALWLSTVEAEEVGPAEMEMIELAGGVDDGNPDETLKVESPEEEIEDPALTEEETDETEIEEVFENVVELSDNAAEQVEQPWPRGVDPRRHGQSGSDQHGQQHERERERGHQRAEVVHREHVGDGVLEVGGGHAPAAAEQPPAHGPNSQPAPLWPSVQ